MMARERARIISKDGYTFGKGIKDSVFAFNKITLEKYPVPMELPPKDEVPEDIDELRSFLDEKFVNVEIFVAYEEKPTLKLYCNSLPVADYQKKHYLFANGSVEHPFQSLNDALQEAYCIYDSTCGAVVVDIRLSGTVDYPIDVPGLSHYDKPISVVISGASDGEMFETSESATWMLSRNLSFRNIKTTFDRLVDSPWIENCDITYTYDVFRVATATKSTFNYSALEKLNIGMHANVLEECTVNNTVFNSLYGDCLLNKCKLNNCLIHTYEDSCTYVINSFIDISEDKYDGRVVSNPDFNPSFFIKCDIKARLSSQTSISGSFFCVYRSSLTVEADNYSALYFTYSINSTVSVVTSSYNAWSPPYFYCDEACVDSTVKIQISGRTSSNGIKQANLVVRLPKTVSGSDFNTSFVGALNDIEFYLPGVTDTKCQNTTFTNRVENIEVFKKQNTNETWEETCNVFLSGAPVGSGLAVQHIFDYPKLDRPDLSKVSTDLRFGVASVGTVLYSGGDCGCIGTGVRYFRYLELGNNIRDEKTVITVNDTYQDVVHTDYRDSSKSYTKKEQLC